MQATYRFGNAELRPMQRQLLVDGQAAALGARAFDLLLTLVERREQVVSKNDLFDTVWPGLVVEENNLSVHVSALRKLLGADAIATIPGRGYRFTASIEGAAIQSHAAEQPAPQIKTFASPTNLPLQLAPLYGREAELAAIKRELDAHRLVTLVGAGGIGKSRLAQAVAHEQIRQWPDGAWMVELAGLSDPALVANVVALALGTKLGGEGEAVIGLVGALAQQSLLLVLDNCEHLLDAVGELAVAIVRGAPNVKVLATSQEPLRLADEQQFRVMPLSVPDNAVDVDPREFGSVALFEARARAIEPRFVLSADSLTIVIDICRRLDGLPLAIELAAVRAPKLGLQALRDKLNERFKLLTGGARAALRRHQTLRAALEWSHNLLSEDERAVFRRLGVFAGGLTMELAQAVARDEQIDEWAVIDHLSALVDKSLVVAEVGDPPRYRLLESARAYALEQLAAAGETGAMLRRHALAVRDLLSRADGAYLDGDLRTDQLEALVEPELDNVRAAHAWASSEDGDFYVAIMIAAQASSVEDFAASCIPWLLPHQARMESEADAATAARYWLALASPGMMFRVALPLQVDAGHRAERLYSALDQPRRLFFIFLMLARREMDSGNTESAHRAAEMARSIVRPDWSALLRLRLLRMESYEATRNDVQRAIALYRETAHSSALAGDWSFELNARNNLADLLWRIGQMSAATRELTQLAQDLGSKPTNATDTAFVYGNLIGISSEMGRQDDAVGFAIRGLPFMRRADMYFLDEFVYLFWRLDEFVTAARALGAVDKRRAGIVAERQPNEERLIAHARPALEEALGREAFAHHLATGAAMSIADLCSLIVAILSKYEPK